MIDYGRKPWSYVVLGTVVLSAIIIPLGHWLDAQQRAEQAKQTVVCANPATKEVIDYTGKITGYDIYHANNVVLFMKDGTHKQLLNIPCEIGEKHNE